MGSKPDVTFRPTDKKDLPLFIEWLLQPGVLVGFPMMNRKEVEDAVRLWNHYIDKGLSLTVCYKKKPVGAANLYMHEVDRLAHQSLFVIILDEKYRGKGIGTLLLKEIIKLGQKRGVEIIHLEVYDKNPAVRLYKRLGFKEYGRHARYLKDVEGNYYDKILMQMGI
ncbi:MAG: GNAT family N-acetyltransferase [Chlamydiia bacterium]|nr:GNAT family N-acetyltransferase [Chlamydiia bacterium]